MVCYDERVRRWLVLIAACGSPPALPSNHPPLELPVLVDGHAQMVSGPYGVFAIASGRVVALDRELRPTGRIDVPDSEAIALAGTADHVYAAYITGEIVEIDPITQAVRPLAHVVDPKWVGIYRGDLAVGYTISPYPFVARFHLPDGKPLGATTLSNGSGAAWTEGAAQVWHVAPHDELWYGIDAGEWGGGLGREDLEIRSASAFDLDDGVYGITHLGNRVFAFGGVVHMMLHEGYVIEYAGGKLVPRYHGEAPVVALEPVGDRLRAVVWNQIMDVSADLAVWTPIATVHARTSSGRPDAVGGYPAVTGMLVLPALTLISTRLDGLWVLRGRELTQLLKPPS